MKRHASWCIVLVAGMTHGALATASATNLPDAATTFQGSSIGTVFAIVLLQQMGLPVPAFPALLIAGSLSGSVASLLPLMMVAVIASVIADSLWYVLGRAFGYRVLAGLCKLSLKPGSCVTSAESFFSRWGVSSLLIAKFVPGLSTVGPPVAGALKLRIGGFLLASVVGAGLWAGIGIFGGWLLRDQVRLALDTLMRQGTIGLVLLVAVIAWFGWALWRKRRFQRSAEIPYITPQKLEQAMQDGAAPLFLDLRSPALATDSGPVQGAVAAPLIDLARVVESSDRRRLIVTICASPGEATSVLAARRLSKMGFTAAYPLLGGYESWRQYVDAKVGR